MFPSIQIQDTSHTIGQTLIVIVLPWQSVQSVTIYHKTEKTKDSDREKAEAEWCLPYLPPRDPFWAACIQPALSCLWQVLLFSLSLSLSLTLALAFSPPSLALPFRLKPEGKSLLLNSDAAGLTNPLNGKVGSSQWESRREGGHNHMRRRKRERKALGNDVGGSGGGGSSPPRERQGKDANIRWGEHKLGNMHWTALQPHCWKRKIARC